MAQQDMQWPSEDEDFDAVSDGQNFAVADFNDIQDEPEPQPSQPEPAHQESREQPEQRAEQPAQHHQRAEQFPQRRVAPTPVRVVSHDEEPIEEPVQDEQLPEEEVYDDQPSNEELPNLDQQEQPQAHDDQLLLEEHYDEPAIVQAKPPKAPKVKKQRKGGAGAFFRGLLEIILVAGVIGLGLWAWTLYTDNKNLKQQVSQLNNNPQVAVQKQTQNLISQVGALMQLPTDETPTIAKVSDVDKAKQQSAFFDNAQNGDEVLLYVKTGEAILYRPSTDKIVLVAPLTFNNSSTSTTATTGAGTTSTTSTTK